MKKFLLLFFVLLSVQFSSFGQEDDVIEVETSIKKISDTEYDLIFELFIEEDWHLYSQFNPKDASAPLKLALGEGQTGFSLVGNATESETHKAFSETWQKEELFFEDEAELTQRIKIEDTSLKQVTIAIKGQVCKEFCLPFEEEFTFSLDGSKIEETVAEVDENSIAKVNALKLNLKNTEFLRVKSARKARIARKANDLTATFLLGFFGGLLAFLTPCVFPLVPLTVSFFTKQSSKKGKGVGNAVMYGFFIVLIYILLSLPFHFIDTLDPDILTQISTNVWLNLVFFVILLFFAGSFFGFYEITLPSSWGNKIDDASGIGGTIGIFFMALTLAIVSFSCTGPILGSLLAGSLTSDGGAIQLTAGMSGFGLALALPFALFAMFPSLLNSLPRSGGWMNTVKIILGFIEVALAFKFLSNADLVGHWDIFKREVFIAIWIVVLFISALFLFGIIRFPSNNRKIKKLAGIRILLGVLAIGSIVYLTPGLLEKPMWNQSLISGLAPPEYHTIYKKSGDNGCPLQLNCFKNFDEGVAYAKSVNKPILLDFTGWACVNCRKMEETVWRTPEVYKMLRDDYVVISLYVDDNEKKLPASEQFDFVKPNGKVKRIKTYGEKWSTMQSVNFQTASQPFYVLMSPDLEILNTPEQYTDVEKYRPWLKRGLENFNH